MRNQMHSFAATPEANIPRSRFNMPCNVKFTGNTGDLIPFYVCEVLPGDTFDVDTSIVCRLQTLIHPIFDNMYLDTYYFFVPNRLVWDNWKHFMGEPDRAWLPNTEWTIPKLNVPSGFIINPAEGYEQYSYANFKDSILDYMGIGVKPTNTAGAFQINALPVRAYNKIFDDWFRDENLEDPINLYTGDAVVSATDSVAHRIDPLRGGKCRKAAKLHDYFTSALPEAQRGNPATFTVGSNIGNLKLSTSSNYYTLANPLQLVHAGATPGQSTGGNVRIDSNKMLSAGLSTGGSNVDQINLYLPLGGQSLGITVNDLRMAFQVQKFMERSARGGARYIELIKSMFGVDSPDARLQRSEYLGGHRVPINIHQIVNTSESAENPLGNTGAMSVTSDNHNDFIHSFTEHGYVIGICCVRYKHSYPQGLDRMWSRQTKFDFYWPVFANIGEQPIKNKEIYIGDAIEREAVFGYQEAWADYRFKPNRVMGEMRPGIPNTLASWTLSDYYDTQPTLSESWIKEDKMPVDRAIAVTSAAADQLLFDILVNNKATRPLPLYSVPGLVDHF